MDKKFIVDTAFWDLFPNVEIAVIEAKNINNQNYNDIPSDLLEKANQIATKWIPNEPISSNEVISDWRVAFKKFKTKKGARCAIESLLKRAKQGKGVKNINPLVDIYNSVSLNWAFPVAGEDLSKIDGNLSLKIANGGEEFWPIGESKPQEALPGEIIYTDNYSVLSRCWSWRDSARVEVTKNTTDVLFYIENVNPKRKKDHEQAVVELQDKLKKYFNADSKKWIITKKSPLINLTSE